jgi:hypothetical protein
LSESITYFRGGNALRVMQKVSDLAKKYIEWNLAQGLRLKARTIDISRVFLSLHLPPYAIHLAPSSKYFLVFNINSA